MRKPRFWGGYIATPVTLAEWMEPGIKCKLSVSKSKLLTTLAHSPRSDGQIPCLLSFFLIFFVYSSVSMVFPSFCGVGWRWGGMERLLACWDFCPLRNNKLFLYIPSSTPFPMELSLSDHSCTVKGKWSCLVFKQYGTHSNCCPGTEVLVNTLECFNWSLPHSLWVMLTSLNTLEWDINLFFLPAFRSLEYDFQVHPTHSFLDTSDQLPFLYLSETIFHQNFLFWAPDVLC